MSVAAVYRSPAAFVMLVTALLFAGVFAAQTVPGSAQAEAARATVDDGSFGLVVSSFNFATTNANLTSTRACPEGPALSFADILNDTARAPDGRNLCQAPTAQMPTPNFRTVQQNVPVYGIDLDGQRAGRANPAANGTCAHEGFPGIDGGGGVDNQFFRTIGCVRGYQPGGIALEFSREMLNGAWSILIAVRGVENLRNDSDVEVGLYAGADPIQLGADRSVLANSTYTATDDARFRAETRGRIVDGVLTTDPVNTRFKFGANGKYYERPLRAARLRLNIAADGVAQGYLAGYSPIDELYQNQVAFNGDTFVSVSAANAIGYTCNGLYAAMHALADGDRDPATGICSSLSTQYRITAVPAFVIDGRR